MNPQMNPLDKNITVSAGITRTAKHLRITPMIVDSSGFGPGNRQTVYYPNFQPMEAAL